MRKKHRIIAVTALFTVVIVGGGGAVLVRQQMLNSRALENRESRARTTATRFIKLAVTFSVTDRTRTPRLSTSMPGLA